MLVVFLKHFKDVVPIFIEFCYFQCQLPFKSFLTFYVLCQFSLSTLKILSLFLVFGSLTLI